jgi:hypothetical protein
VSIPSAAVAAQLVGGSRYWRFRYEALNNSNVFIRTLNVVQCSVANNALADKAKRTCKVRIHPSTTFDQLDERFRAYADLRMPDGTFTTFTLGTFLLSTGSNRTAALAGDRDVDYEGYDLLQVLVEDKVLDRYVVAAGTVYTTAIGTVLTSAGFTTSQISGSAATLPSAMEWPPGTPKLTIVNDMLTAINFTTLSMTATGDPTAQPYVEPASAQVVWNYVVGPQSVVTPGIDRRLDLFDVPNVWLGVVSQPDRAPLVSTDTNNVPGSPTSVAARGRSIVRVLDDVGDAADQATLDALVVRRANESSVIYEEADFTTGLMPFHETGEVFLLDDGSGTGPSPFREQTWEMDLRAGGLMKHTMRRTVSL